MCFKWIVLILGVCCLIHLARGQSDESSSDYEDEEKDEFADMKNDKDFKRDKMSGRARDPFTKRDGEEDEFAGMEEEFQNDKDFLNMKDDDKTGKDKDDIEFQLAFGEDDSKEKNEKDEFYHAVKDDVDEDFNMYSSNKMNKRVKCDNPEDCEDLKSARSEDPENDGIDSNRTSIDRLVDSDKTTIMYVNSDPTNEPPNSYNSYNSEQPPPPPPHRQYEEETSLKAEHHQEDDHWNTPLECDCDTKIQPKIIGGSPAAKNKYPYAVAIFTLVGRGSFCGGTIINERYILTAQHCVQRHYRNPRNYNVVAGRTDLNVSDILEDFVTKASHIWLNGRSNDVALVRLSQPLDFSNAIKPACFGGPSIVPKDQPSYGYNKFGFDSSHFNNLENVSKHFKKTNRTLRAIGWGYVGWKVTKINGKSKIRPLMTTKLQEVDLNEVICAKEEYLICVEGKGKSPCFGDSGSPLLYDHFEKWVVVGLTSRSSSSKARFCLGAPTIYERSAYYLPWLKTLTSNRICVVD